MFTFQDDKVELYFNPDIHFVLFRDGKFTWDYDDLHKFSGNWTLNDKILTLWITEEDGLKVNRVQSIYWEEVYEYPHPINIYTTLNCSYGKVYKSNVDIGLFQAGEWYYYENPTYSSRQS